MKLRKTIQMMALLAIFSLIASAPHANALDDEHEMNSGVQKKLSDLVGRYYEFKDASSYLNMEKAIKEIRGQLDEAAKKWRLDIESSDQALQYIDAYVAPLNLFPKWDAKFKTGRLEQGEGFHLHLPKGYKGGRSVKKLEDFIPIIVDIRPADEDAEAWFKKSWEGQPVLETAALLLPSPPKDGDWNGDEGLASILAPLGNLSWDQVAIDQNGMFLCGNGKTAAIAARIAARFSDRFAGCLLRSGGTDETFFAPNLARIAVFASEESPLTKEVSNAQGNVTQGKAEGDALAKWIADTRRVLYPEKVQGVVKDLTYGDATWLKVRELSVAPEEAQKPEDFPKFQASLNREGNKIQIDSKGISKFYIRLNDDVLDLNKEIVVEINGQEALKGKIERNIDELLDTAFATGERGRLWSRIIEVNVPADASTPK